MKIGQSSEVQAAKAAGVAAQKVAAEGRAAPAQQAQSQGASVAVSVSASIDKGVRNASGDIDMVKVNAVRNAIRDGSFKINPEVIASKMLANAAEMLKISRS